ncbi:hypothetical protein KY321_04130 [Candidatus Woesearchaeota archaeon]|nr:hypothetical protein [Candidatus Woesearchaeota archaeon]
MSHITFIFSLTIVEIFLLVLICSQIIKIFLKESKTDEFKILPKNEKINTFSKLFTGIFTKNQYVEKYSKEYTILSTFTVPFVILLMEIIFSMIFGPYVFFRSSGIFNWLLFYIMKNLLIIIAVLVIINGILRYNKFRKL